MKTTLPTAARESVEGEPLRRNAVEVQSEPDCGTTFRITLPIRRRPAGNADKDQGI